MNEKKHMQAQRDQERPSALHLAPNARPEQVMQREPVAAHAYQRMLGGTPSFSPADIRSLQHILGNQAVQRLLAGTAPRQVEEAPLQRQAAPTQKKENTTGLPDTLKAGVEHLSGLSLDDVNVHYHSPKPAQVQALAYTQGTEIHVGPGQEQHLPHEAWHVVQQKQDRVKPTRQINGLSINDDQTLEEEAGVMGARAANTTRIAQMQSKVEGLGRLQQEDTQAVADRSSNGHLYASQRYFDRETPLVHLKLRERSKDVGRETSGFGDAPVQLVAVQVVLSAQGTIEEVIIGGRAGSLWGPRAERHHTTPWQTYVDLINGVVVSLSLDEAIQSMSELVDALENLPGWGLIDELSDPMREAIQAEIANMQNQMHAANTEPENSQRLASLLQQYINAWLMVRTRFPLAQGLVGGGAATVANAAETARGANTGLYVDPATLSQALINLFDFRTVENVFTSPQGVNAEEEYEHFGLNRQVTDLSLDQLRNRVFLQHARSIEETYPTAFNQVFNNPEAMVAAMEEHWANVGDEDEEFQGDEDEEGSMSSSGSSAGSLLWQ